MISINSLNFITNNLKWKWVVLNLPILNLRFAYIEFKTKVRMHNITINDYKIWKIRKHMYNLPTISLIFMEDKKYMSWFISKHLINSHTTKLGFDQTKHLPLHSKIIRIYFLHAKEESNQIYFILFCQHKNFQKHDFRKLLYNYFYLNGKQDMSNKDQKHVNYIFTTRFILQM